MVKVGGRSYYRYVEHWLILMLHPSATDNLELKIYGKKMYLYSKYDLTFVILLIKIKSKKVDCDIQIQVYIIFLRFHAIPLLFYSGKIIILVNGH